MLSRWVNRCSTTRTAQRSLSTIPETGPRAGRAACPAAGMDEPGGFGLIMKTSQGFTLIELLVTLTVLAVLLTVAVRSYQSFVVTQRIKGASYDLMTALIFARSEATKRNASVNLVRSA